MVRAGDEVREFNFSEVQNFNISKRLQKRSNHPSENDPPYSNSELYLCSRSVLYRCMASRRLKPFAGGVPVYRTPAEHWANAIPIGATRHDACGLVLWRASGGPAVTTSSNMH